MLARRGGGSSSGTGEQADEGRMIPLTAAEVEKVLKKNGFVHTRTVGSHFQQKKSLEEIKAKLAK